MTGKELISALQKLSEDELNLEVETEGCDCWGDVAKVEILHHEYSPKEHLWHHAIQLCRATPDYDNDDPYGYGDGDLADVNT